MIVLCVNDVAASKKFYQSIFNWKIVLDIPDVVVQFELENQEILMFYNRTGFETNIESEVVTIAPDQLSGTELYLHVNNINSIIPKIVSLGGTILSPLKERSWGDTAVYFRDIDGNILALANTH